MTYERAKYPAEQRAWVAAADERLPGLIEKAVQRQTEAAEMHAYIQLIFNGGGVAGNSWFRLRQQASRDALNALQQVLYYQGMRNANL